LVEEDVGHPAHNAEFVYHMEDVLDVYTRPYDPRYPQVCLDEASKQLLAEVREPLPSLPGHVQRVDSEDARHGTANLWMLFEPLASWRAVCVTDQRTRTDFAHIIHYLVDQRYPHAERIILVLDQLNTHSPASLYAAFAPHEAKRLADKLEIHYTPKHGSWLNMAEIEFSVLARQCLAARIADRDTLTHQVTAWATQRNQAHLTVDWRFTTADARIKLKRLYPSILP
jgi:hypothetical protein